MSMWDLYETRMDARGSSRREAALNRERQMLTRKLPRSLSYQSVVINGVERQAAIINSDNLDQKNIYVKDKGVIRGGELVEWADNRWLVVECDANTEVYTRAVMRQCNHLLRWIDRKHHIHEQWCIIEDGTKLRRLVSAQSNLCVKISIELLETPKAHITTA